MANSLVDPLDQSVLTEGDGEVEEVQNFEMNNPVSEVRNTTPRVYGQDDLAAFDLSGDSQGIDSQPISDSGFGC